MSSTGSRERSDQIPVQGRGMTAYQKEKSRQEARLRARTPSWSAAPRAAASFPGREERKVGQEGMKNK